MASADISKISPTERLDKIIISLREIVYDVVSFTGMSFRDAMKLRLDDALGILRASKRKLYNQTRLIEVAVANHKSNKRKKFQQYLDKEIEKTKHPSLRGSGKKKLSITDIKRMAKEKDEWK